MAVSHSPRRIPCAERSRLAGVALLLVACIATAAFARSAPHATPDVLLSDLPKEAQQVYTLIGKGGPFRYSRDGVVFGNREELLPLKSRSYYHEYTVRTPGAKDRGARRIICGGPKTTPEACYYTDDHYQSFRRIRQ
jgi:ribonuclease T1